MRNRDEITVFLLSSWASYAAFVRPINAHAGLEGPA
jgi:hypothetical protein